MRGSILIVDDDVVCLRVLTRMVQKLGYLTVPVASTAEAFRVLETARIDLIISDQNMPDMLGHEFLEEVQARGWKMPSILVSSHESIELRDDEGNVLPGIVNRKEFLQNLDNAIDTGLDYRPAG